MASSICLGPATLGSGGNPVDIPVQAAWEHRACLDLLCWIWGSLHSQLPAEGQHRLLGQQADTRPFSPWQVQSWFYYMQRIFCLGIWVSQPWKPFFPDESHYDPLSSLYSLYLGSEECEPGLCFIQFLPALSLKTGSKGPSKSSFGVHQTRNFAALIWGIVKVSGQTFFFFTGKLPLPAHCSTSSLGFRSYEEEGCCWQTCNSADK